MSYNVYKPRSHDPADVHDPSAWQQILGSPDTSYIELHMSLAVVPTIGDVGIMYTPFRIVGPATGHSMKNGIKVCLFKIKLKYMSNINNLLNY